MTKFVTGMFKAIYDVEIKPVHGVWTDTREKGMRIYKSYDDKFVAEEIAQALRFTVYGNVRVMEAKVTERFVPVEEIPLNEKEG